MVNKKIVILSLVLLSTFSYLGAQSLETLVDNSIEKSSQIKTLDLNKRYTLLNLQRSELPPKPTVNVDVNSQMGEDTYTVEGGYNGLVSIIIPGDHIPTSPTGVSNTTTISLGGGLLHDRTGASPKTDLKGSATVYHNFLLGDYSNNENSLNSELTRLRADQAYKNGEISFKKNVYNYVSSIILNEKSQRDIEKKIVDQEKTIKDSLALGYITKDSLSYRQNNLILKTFKDSLENIQFQKESLLKNFKEYTGIDYVQVDEVREPNLEIKDSQNNNSISVQLATINKELKNNKIAQVEKKKTQSYINVGGRVDRPYPKTILEVKNEDMSVAAEATYNANNFSVNAGTQVNIDFSNNTVKPGFSVGGTWTNNTTNESDNIQNQLNENELNSAIIALNSTIQSQQLNKLTLNSQITNWKSQYNQLMDNIKFKEDDLKIKEEMFTLGLSSQKELDDLAFEIEQLNYDKKALLIDGLSIELDIEKLQL